MTLTSAGGGAAPDETGLIAAAVARGIVTPEQGAQLAALALELAPRHRPRPRDDETLRFVGGFGDIFVTIGLGLFVGAAGYIANLAGNPLPGPLVALVLSWGLAEYFTRVRRMALPSIVLLGAFAAAAFFTILAVTLVASPADPGNPLPLAIAALGAALAVGLHYRRFGVPITVAAAVAGLGGALLKGIEAAAPAAYAAWENPLLFVTGLAVFTLAMRIDVTDTARLTRRTDVAFWLHLLAAPLIVHPVLSSMHDGNATPGQAAAVLGVFAVLGVVALAVDRRAILVSGLLYAGFAFADILHQVGLGDLIMPATFLALGGLVLLLAAFWQPLRGVILPLLPVGLRRHLAQPGTASTG